ncbi:hypothetical protein [Lysobacter gummosus]|uniref:hypothetical protein n=1 Tax=Lysobacter gummosus TaxID=262324 RepID=UPI00362F7415
MLRWAFLQKRELGDFSAISPCRHSREGGNPGPSASSFQTVIPANAGIQRLQRHLSRPSFPRRRESSGFSVIFPGRHSREGGNPVASASSFQAVIPAKAGIQRLQRHLSRSSFPRMWESSDFNVIFPGRHSRECGNPATSASSFQAVIPRTRESSDFRRSRTKGTGFPRSRE